MSPTQQPDLVKAAKAKLEELGRQAAAIEKERAELEAFIATAAKLQSDVHSAVCALARSEAPTPTAELIKRARAIIEAVGGPVPLADLHKALLREGAVIGGKDQRSNLSAKLSGASGLKSIPGKGWVIETEKGPAASTAEPYLNGGPTSSDLARGLQIATT